jgi:hypothetical protein
MKTSIPAKVKVPAIVNVLHWNDGNRTLIPQNDTRPKGSRDELFILKTKHQVQSGPGPDQGWQESILDQRSILDEIRVHSQNIDSATKSGGK